MMARSCCTQRLHTTQLLPSSSPPSPLLPLLPFLPSPGFGFCYFLPRTLGDPGGEPGSHWKAKAASLSAASATAASALTITTAMRTSAICHEPLLHQPPLPPPRAPPQATPPCAPRQASRFLASASAIIATALASIAAAVVCASQQPTIKLRLWRHVQASVASESYGELRDVKLIPSMDLPSIILTFSHTTESAHSTDQHLFIITCMHSSCACFFTIGSSSCGSIEHQLGWMHICFGCVSFITHLQHVASAWLIHFNPWDTSDALWFVHLA